jgi:MFS family permease
LHANSNGRFVLGLGEAGNWPACVKVVAEWFPVEERALASGIFNSGASVGAILAPPILVALLLHYGWRQAFVCQWLLRWRLLFGVHRGMRSGALLHRNDCCVTLHAVGPYRRPHHNASCTRLCPSETRPT